MPLTAEDLAYMRETQDEHRPTAATLTRVAATSDGMGGETTTDGAGVAVTVRIRSLESMGGRAPDGLVTEYGTSLVLVTMDLVEVSSGDHITVTGAEVYQVVSDGAVEAWDTAQQVYATRRGARQS